MAFESLHRRSHVSHFDKGIRSEQKLDPGLGLVMSAMDTFDKLAFGSIHADYDLIELAIFFGVNPCLHNFGFHVDHTFQGTLPHCAISFPAESSNCIPTVDD
jgi:hypothetical protein